MKNNSYMYLLLVALMTVFFAGCGGGSTPAVQPPALQVTASKSLALANNTDAITVTATFQAPLPPNGSVVNFSLVSGTATLSGVTTTNNGAATVTVKSATAGQVTVKADFAGGTASTAVKFIAQPTRMDITIALNQRVTSLGALQFSLISDQGATYNNDVKAINGADGQSVDAIPVSGNQLNIGLISGTSFDTLASPIISLSYAITAGTLPGVLVSPAGILVNDGASRPIYTTNQLIPDLFVVTVNYI